VLIQEDYFKNIFNTVHEGIIILDENLRVLTANRSFYKFFKVKPEETVGQLIYDLGNKQWDISKLRELLETILPQKATFDNYEVEHDFTTIGRRIMLLNARQIQRVLGKERIILLAIEDITERKEIEAGLEKTRKELAATKISEDEAREYSESIINTVREPLIVMDQDLRVVTASRSFYEFFKVKPEETVGQLIYDLGNKQWDIPKLQTLLEEILLKDKKFDDYEVEHDFSNIGQKIMLLNARRITQKEIGSQLILLAIEDVTEKMRLQRELAERTRDAEKAQSEAEAATRAKSDFLANMSHELRTPLNAIIGFSEILKDGIAGPIADNQKELLNDISTSGKHLLSLINDILDLSKVEAGKMELELSEFNLNELIDGSLVMFKEKAMKHNIKIAAKVAAGTGNIIADERKIKQVLFNLLSNAFKFTPDGGSVRVQARLVNSEQYLVNGKKLFTDDYSLTTHGNFVEISVEDTGIGISPEDQKKLFQPFQQIDSTLSRKYSGTGLGLNLCKQFIELHGGRIWIESEVEKGSRFVFSIPLKKVE
jgi:PAS domain S-box-containing protein